MGIESFCSVRSEQSQSSMFNDVEKNQLKGLIRKPRGGDWAGRIEGGTRMLWDKRTSVGLGICRYSQSNTFELLLYLPFPHPNP